MNNSEDPDRTIAEWNKVIAALTLEEPGEVDMPPAPLLLYGSDAPNKKIDDDGNDEEEPAL